MDGVWPWLLMALFGAYHGLNPAMGWLFAVALLHPQRHGEQPAHRRVQPVVGAEQRDQRQRPELLHQRSGKQ